MIQIQNITVKNFKNIELADLNLKPLNVIIGPNGSGKTNLLMIFRLLKQILRGSNDDVEEFFLKGYSLTLGTILPTQNRAAKNCSLSLLFIDTSLDIVYNYSISIEAAKSQSKIVIGHEEFSFKKRSATGLPTKIFIRKGGELTYHQKIKKLLPIASLKEYVSAIKPIELVQDSLDNKFRDAFQAIENILDSPTYYFSSVSLRHSRKPNYSFLDDRITSIDIEESIGKVSQTENWQYFKEMTKSIAGIEDIEINYKDNTNNEINYVTFQYLNRPNLVHHLSDGVLILIGIILQTITSKSDIILLEEPENSIHPKALSNLMAFIRSRSEFNQFIISTHSNGLINLLSPSEIIVSEIQKNGLSMIAHISNEKELKRKLGKGFASLGDLVFQGETDFEDLF
jgi:predicted ATP-dependent endonuclease of OLD family